MKDCHRAIKERVEPNRLYYSFVSTIEHAEYEYLSTASVLSETIERSFRALHPEWDKKAGWAHPNIQRALDALTAHYQFQHGARLFTGNRAGAPNGQLEKKDGYSPIHRALDKVAPRSSRAYVGLYNPDLDTAPESQMPTLTGIQFLREDNFLDLVVTFRKIELSAWWVVNMLEASLILKWAASKITKIKTRRITFFASIAEWKMEPSLTVIPYLDDLETVSLAELTAIAVSACRGEASGRTRLLELLTDKRLFTHIDNIDPSGLLRLGSVLEGAYKGSAGSSVLDNSLIQHVQEAARFLQGALEHGREDRRAHDVTESLAQIERAIDSLRGVITS